jgi:para-aminobenzoate synthetase/4-amino-4-deoxychorismate lyase
MGESITFDRVRDAPFVLLDDARVGMEGCARLYTAPREIVIARRPDEVAPALARIEALLSQGYAMAGHIGYEAGLALEPRLAPLADARSGADGPLIWMGAFDGWRDMSSAQVAAWLDECAKPNPAPRIGPMVPAIGAGAYAQAFDHIAEAIRAGDIYQANFTFPLTGPWSGDPLASMPNCAPAAGRPWRHPVRRAILAAQPVARIVFRGAGPPIARQTHERHPPARQHPESDAALARELFESVKDRSENLMILDLMRNDIARVSDAGSVRVDAPFAIESYPTVHQMVSTVNARLEDGRSLVDVIRALFPCGSVTGAPKIRAMELIHAHERDPRGIYCGSLGHIDPANATNSAGSASFNVAIRSLRLAPDGKAVLGVGSAVVADSVAIDEWRECLVKGGFVHQPAPDKMIAGFDLIETMAFDPELGVPMLEAHLERMKESAGLLGFSFDRHARAMRSMPCVSRWKSLHACALFWGAAGRSAWRSAPCPRRWMGMRRCRSSPADPAGYGRLAFAAQDHGPLVL